MSRAWWVAVGWLLLLEPTVAQTAWPDYMPGLAPALSESPIAAVLPNDVVVVAPDALVPPEKARWSGIWQGWACRGWQCDIKIAIEKVSETGATVAYAGASAGQGLITDRADGRFVDGELRLRLRTGANLVLRLRTSGDMEMSLWRPANQLLSAGVLSQAPLNYTRDIQRIATPWIENGKALTLEMVVYKPAMPGRFPTLVFNHGSTGIGDKPEWFTRTWTSPEIARYFVNKGWMVLFPQRRGRGKSDGLYDEGFEVDRSRYSCQPELSIPGLDRAVADLEVVMAHVQNRGDVDAHRLLIGGVSRGGILSVAFAGTHANAFLGVLNFVGGWVGDGCPRANDVNPVLFQRGAAFGKPTLWLYGDRDPFYSLRHSRKNFEAFLAAGGRGSFVTFDPPRDQNGHAISANPALWQGTVDTYLEQIIPP